MIIIFSILARNFIIQHTFKNSYFADLQKYEFDRPTIWALFVCPKTYFKIISSHLGFLVQTPYLVFPPLNLGYCKA